MLGAVIGDIVGSIYEAHPIKTKDFGLFGPGCRFTDDTVCTVAVADAVLAGGDFAAALRTYVRRYPNAGYGSLFRQWALTDAMPAYGSWGNGAAMRVSPIGYAAADADAALDLAARTAIFSHDHATAVAGAQAVALAIWLARQGTPTGAIRTRLSAAFGYDLTASVDGIRPGYCFDVSTIGTVPPAIVCALEASDFEDAVRNAVSLGGDSDTLACIAGAIAEPLFGVPAALAAEARRYLDSHLADVVERFQRTYP